MECYAEWVVEESEGDGVTFKGGVDGQDAAFYAGVGDAVVAEGGEGGDAGGVDEVAEVGEDVDVGAEGPDLGESVSGFYSFEEGVVSSIERACEKKQGITYLLPGN